MRRDKEALSLVLMEPVCSWTPLGSPSFWVEGSLPTLLLTPPSLADTTKVLGLVVRDILAGDFAKVLQV